MPHDSTAIDERTDHHVGFKPPSWWSDCVIDWLTEPKTYGELPFLGYLLDTGHLYPKRMGGRRYAAVLRFAFTVGIITGRIGDRVGYDDRWCYRNHTSAKRALDAWDGKDEPAGWHRHPASGRRLAETDDCYDDHGKLVPIGAMYVRG